MRICHGPRLFVDRGCHRQGYWGWYAGPHAYERKLAADKLHRRRHGGSGPTRCDRKRRAIWFRDVRPGQSFRRLDCDGASIGRRWTAPMAVHPERLVRLVQRQAEDPHSRACRALKAAHNFFIRTP